MIYRKLPHGSEQISIIGMGTAVVGGMLISTFFTMYIVPSIYSYISSARKDKDEE